MAHTATDLSYCGQEVRRYDNDRFLTCLFAPADRREDLFTLYAFNVEVAKTREVVSEPMLGQMRLQWWRDAVASAYGDGPAPEHAVVRPLAAAVSGRRLSRDHFERLIDGREADLDEETPASLACLTNYAEVTAVPLVRLALEALGAHEAAASPVARHVGLGYALAGILRAVPHHARQRRVLLPADRMAAHGARPRDVLELRAPAELRPVAQEVAACARDHLAQARALRRDVPRNALAALLPAVVATAHLDRIAAAGHDVFAAKVQFPNAMRQIRLGWAALRGRY